MHVPFSIPSSSPDRAASVTVLEDVHATMRDGIRLGADVYLPDGVIPAPAILVREPYGRRTEDMGFDIVGRFFASKGYACVVQDVRGKFSSEGEFDPGVHEVDDSYDTADWAAGQEWCNGRIGCWGESYYGATSYAAAISRHPAIACIAPGDITVDRREGWMRQGAFLLNTTGYWAIAMDAAGYADVAALDPFTLPLLDLPATVGAEGHFFRELLEHLDDAAWWAARSLAGRLGEVRVPVLCWGGWYDNYIGPQLEDYAELQRVHPHPETVHLMVGPWDHEGSADYTDRAVCVRVPPTAAHRWAAYEQFFDRYLLGVDNGFGEAGAVDVFTLAANRWESLPSWPPPGVEQQALYLRAEGRLSAEAPAADEPADGFRYDPLDPVTSTVGRNCWALCTALGDRRALDERTDILRYIGEPLDQDMLVLGPIVAELHAATSAVDTDFTVTLCDVFEDGTVNTVQDGIVRARYRDGFDAPAPVVPGEVVAYTIRLNAAAYLLRRGHRLRVDVSSSEFDRYDRNLNTGAAPGQTADVVVAEQAVHHSPGRASRVLVSVRPAV